MSRFQKVFYILISVCFVAVLLPFLWNCWCLRGTGSKKSLLEALPLYRFLEKEKKGPVQDETTYDKILEANRQYLKEKVMAENSDSGQDPKETGETMQEGGESRTEEPDTGLSSHEENPSSEASAVPHPVLDLSPETLADYDYLLGQFYIVDSTTATSPEQLNAASFLGQDLSVARDPSCPQILIYHSHSQEGFADSDLSDPEDRVVGVGNYLTQLLEENYGYQVIHITEEFDVIDGVVDRSAAYDVANAYVSQVLEENPSVEVVIDLHRDGVPEDRHLVTEINGKPTAMIMNFNGLSYTAANGPIDYLPNPYIQENLAFSFQLIYQAAQYYPELYRGNYLAGYRYNLELRPRALLLEAGAQTNTVQEVKNAMEPFADILNKVLQAEP